MTGSGGMAVAGEVMADLKGKVAIVTGGAAGIGRATCLALASRGARVGIGDLDLANAMTAEEDVTEQGGEAESFHVDVRDQMSVDRFVRAAADRFGRIDIVVPNAGVQRRAFVHELAEEEFREVLDINLLGVFRTCRAALPYLYEQRTGTIIIVASDAGKHGEAFTAAYAASKFGVLGFMESLADEARTRGVRVNAVCPGAVRTALSLRLRRADGRQYDTSSWMEADEVADVIAFLASDGSRAMTGTSVDVPGGVQIAHGTQTGEDGRT